MKEKFDRRTFVAALGSASLVGIAGCGQGGDGGGGGGEGGGGGAGGGDGAAGDGAGGEETPENETQTPENETQTPENETQTPENETQTPEDTPQETPDETPEGTPQGASGGTDAIDPQEEIQLGGEVSAWQGMAPDAIADQENPTLVLQEGESYTVTWENLDGAGHNFAIRDENGETLGSTEIIQEQGQTQTVDFEATANMAEYLCEPHEASMNGDIQVEGGGSGGS